MPEDKSYGGRTSIESVLAILFGNRIEGIAAALDILYQKFFK
jgi:hypothetical protein